MSFVLLSAFAVHCGFSSQIVIPSSFLILEKQPDMYYKLVTDNIADFAARTNLFFISERDALHVYSKDDWSLNRQKDTVEISKNEKQPTLLSELNPSSPYIGSLSSGKNVLYVFYLYPMEDSYRFDYNIVKTAIQELAIVANAGQFTEGLTETLIDDFYKSSEVRYGQPMSKTGITAVVVEKDLMSIKYAEETLQLEGTVSTTVSTIQEGSSCLISEPPVYNSNYKFEFPKEMEAPVYNGKFTINLKKRQKFVGFFDKVALKSDNTITRMSQIAAKWLGKSRLTRVFILFGAQPIDLGNLFAAIKGNPFADYATIAKKMGIKVDAPIGEHTITT